MIALLNENELTQSPLPADLRPRYRGANVPGDASAKSLWTALARAQCILQCAGYCGGWAAAGVRQQRQLLSLFQPNSGVYLSSARYW